MLLAEVCLMTNDVRLLSDFYCKTLGTTSDCDSDVHQLIRVEGVEFAIYNDGNVKPLPHSNTCLAFTVDDIEAEYTRLLSMGIAILQPPVAQPWGAVNMCFEDPDGNQIFFRSFPKK